MVGLDRLRDALDRPVRQPCCLSVAEIGAHGAGGAGLRRSPDRRIGAAIALGIAAKCALVEVVVRVRPERIVRVGIEGVVDEVIVRIGPEHGPDPADDDRPRPMPLPSGIEEPPLECRSCQRRRIAPSATGSVGKGLVAQDATRRRPVGVGRLQRPGRLTFRRHTGGRCRRLRALAGLASRMIATFELPSLLCRSGNCSVLLPRGDRRTGRTRELLWRSAVRLWRRARRGCDLRSNRFRCLRHGARLRHGAWRGDAWRGRSRGRGCPLSSRRMWCRCRSRPRCGMCPRRRTRRLRCR
jgi:hypothetical protein